MKGTTTSLRYAKALFLTAKEQQVLNEVLIDMRALAMLIGKKTELFDLVKDPTLRHKKKASLFKKIFTKKFNKTTMNFLFFILKKSRESLLLDIIEKYKMLYNRHQGIVTAELVTSQPLSSELKEVIKQKISSTQDVNLKETIDKTLLGGFIINSGDFQYDASIRKKINNVKRAFKL